MTTYPKITGTYSDAAWRRAELFTDGRITDGILAGCETQIEAERALRPTRADLVKARDAAADAVRHYRHNLAAAHMHGRAADARAAEWNLNWCIADLARAEAALVAAEMEEV